MYISMVRIGYTNGRNQDIKHQIIRHITQKIFGEIITFTDQKIIMTNQLDKKK